MWELGWVEDKGCHIRQRVVDEDQTEGVVRLGETIPWWYSAREMAADDGETTT
ncbi:UNVERIFIED_CONTAM: hypothetical protein Sradi_3677300 [Sesamum radiatum]|uniref:Uncharacterized protein n=1 Tax=Sesamum radiatum TaxID=300843 RepID=A0AAW2QIX5_SESRA